MSFGNDFSLDRGYEQSQSMAAERAAFIRRTYLHVAGALAAMVGLMALLLSSEAITGAIIRAMWGSTLSYFLTLAAFIGVSYLAQYYAAQQTSKGMQYFGLGLYVVLMSVLLLPLVAIAQYLGVKDPVRFGNIIPMAAIMTGTIFLGLTAVVLTTRKDFSFLGSLLTILSFVALGVIVAAAIFGFTLGLVFCAAMVAIMAGYILYDTSNVLHHYDTNQHVAAALTLFADIGMLFYYILRILLILASSRE